MKKKRTLRVFIEELILLLCTIIMLLPVFYFVIGAFKERSDIIKFPLLLTKEMFTLENFPYVIKKMDYWAALKNTATITGVSLIIVVVSASLAGFAVARISGKFFKGYYGLIVTLMVIPFIGCLIPIAVLSVKLGLYNTIWGCILIQSAWNLPFAVFLYTGFMRDLPKELEEAAKIDGCNTLKTLWYVIVPMLKPSLVSCALFQFMWTNNDFQGPLIYIADMQKYTNSVYLRMSMDGDVGFQWNRILAMSLISIVPSLIVFFCAQDSFIDGIAAGGVKG